MGNAALVVLRHGMDDIPIQLFTESAGYRAKKRALEFIRVAKPEEIKEIAKYWDTDASTPNALAIVEFDTLGRPHEVEVVRTIFDEERFFEAIAGY
jgi:hypothetical protein